MKELELADDVGVGVCVHDVKAFAYVNEVDENNYNARHVLDIVTVKRVQFPYLVTIPK